MRALRSVLVVVVVAGVTLAPGPVAAGGWWTSIDLDGSYLAVGERLTFKQQVMFKDIPAAQRALHEDYGAYLVSDIDQRMMDRAMTTSDPKRWWGPLGEIIRIGEVDIPTSDSNLMWTTVRIKVPEVPIDTYYLMLCDTGCRTPLADVVPSPVTVSDDVLAVKTARRLERTTERSDTDLRSLDARLRRSRARVATLEDRILRMGNRMGQMDERIDVVLTRLASLDRGTPWSAYATGTAAGMLLTSLVVGALFRRRVPGSVGAIAVPDDARELIDAKTPFTIS